MSFTYQIHNRQTETERNSKDMDGTLKFPGKGDTKTPIAILRPNSFLKKKCENTFPSI